MIHCAQWDALESATPRVAYTHLAVALALYLCVATGEAEEHTTGPLAFIMNQDENTVSVITIIVAVFDRQIEFKKSSSFF